MRKNMDVRNIGNDPNRYKLNRGDLERAERKIYDRCEAMLKQKPSPDQAHMLAVFAYGERELEKAAKGTALADHLLRCTVYARNKLGPWKPEPISLLELSLELEGETDWPPVCLFLEGLWEVMPAPATPSGLKARLQAIFREARARYKETYRRVYDELDGHS